MPPRKQSIRVAHECACFAARRASRAITRVYEEPVARAGLEPTQFTLLNAIRLLEPASIRKLAWSLQADETTLARNLRLLERRGLVTITSSEEDRRVRITARIGCPADLNFSGEVDTVDLLALLALWGPCAAPCAADFDCDGTVGVTDLLDMLGQWGPCAR